MKGMRYRMIGMVLMAVMVVGTSGVCGAAEQRDVIIGTHEAGSRFYVSGSAFADLITKQTKYNGKVMAGPVSAVKKHCKQHTELGQGSQKASDVAKRLAKKLGNPRLKRITFHTFRHFFATMLYAKTLNILKVQRALGHKNINNTIIYTHLVTFESDDYEVQTAETVEEAKKLGEAGFEHYDTIEQVHLYRRRK